MSWWRTYTQSHAVHNSTTHTITHTHTHTHQILELAELDEEKGTSWWRLADVRANAPVKGRKLSKRQREARIELPISSIQKARVHVDF